MKNNMEWNWFNPHLYHDVPLVRQTVNHHLQRYLFIILEIKNSCKTALDIGCGSGYGSHLLTITDMNVNGIDIDPEAICYANKHYKSCYFSQLSWKYSFNLWHTYDLVVYYEFLEHMNKEDGLFFLHNIYHITNKYIFLSTPVDAKIGVNPCHFSEWSTKDIQNNLSGFDCEFFFQDWETGVISKQRNNGIIICKARRL